MERDLVASTQGHSVTLEGNSLPGFSNLSRKSDSCRALETSTESDTGFLFSHVAIARTDL